MNTSKKLRWGMAVLAASASVPGLGLAAPAVAEGAAAPAPIQHTVYVAMVDNHGAYDYSDKAILQEIDHMLDRWRQATDGRVTFVRKPLIKFDDASDCTNPSTLRAEARALPELQGTDTSPSATTGENLIVLTPPACAGESGNNGTHRLQSSGGMTVNGDVAKLYQETFHEFGHIFGLAHANAMWCEPDCGWREYRNHYSSMGTSWLRSLASGPYAVPALDSYQRSRLGLDGDDVATVTLAPGVRTHTQEFVLNPRSDDAGLRGARVIDPTTGTTYYFEFRNGSGVDADTYYADQSQNGRFVFNRGITVEKVGVDPNGYENAILQTFPKLDGNGWRYAKTADPGEAPFEAGGVRMSVTSMSLTNSATDTARISITLTDPSVPLSVQDSGSVAITPSGDEGSTLTATTSGWAADATLSPVQWYDDGTAIAGATGPTYVIPAGTHGHTITARVTGSLESYEDRTQTSNAVVVGEGFAGSLVDGATYEIRSVDTNRLVSDQGPQTNLKNTQVVAADGPSTTSTRWTVKVLPSGAYRLRNLGSSKCLDDERALVNEGNPIIVWGCATAAANQSWTLVGSGRGYALVNQASRLALTPQGTTNLLGQSSGSYAWTFTKVS